MRLDGDRLYVDGEFTAWHPKDPCIDGCTEPKLIDFWAPAGLRLASGPKSDPDARPSHYCYGDAPGSYTVQLADGEGARLRASLDEVEAVTGQTFQARIPVFIDGGDLGQAPGVFPLVLGADHYNPFWHCGRPKWAVGMESYVRQWVVCVRGADPSFSQWCIDLRDHQAALQIAGQTRFRIHGPSGAPTLNQVAYFRLWADSRRTL